MKKNRDFGPISHFISEIIQDKAIVMEPQQELVRDLSNDDISNDLD